MQTCETFPSELIKDGKIQDLSLFTPFYIILHIVIQPCKPIKWCPLALDFFLFSLSKEKLDLAMVMHCELIQPCNDISRDLSITGISLYKMAKTDV